MFFSHPCRWMWPSSVQRVVGGSDVWIFQVVCPPLPLPSFREVVAATGHAEKFILKRWQSDKREGGWDPG